MSARNENAWCNHTDDDLTRAANEYRTHPNLGFLAECANDIDTELARRRTERAER